MTELELKAKRLKGKVVERISPYIDKLKRVEGSEKLIEFLKESDYLTAPASTRFHLSEPSGLANHSINMVETLLDFTNKHNLVWQREESPIIIGLLHDLCKVNFYKITSRNIKDENGKWIQVPSYEVKDKEPLGHGEKSVMLILQKGFKLTDEELYSIRWHMGFSNVTETEKVSVGEAFKKYPNAFWSAVADQWSGINE